MDISSPSPPGKGRWADALITGSFLHNVSISGEGVIDGNGNLHTHCTAAGATERPGCKMVALRSCSGVKVSGVRFKRGGWFTFLWTDVSDVHIHDIDITAARDGIDLVGARDVLAERIRIHDGGDDAFVLKSDWSIGRVLDSRNITLRNSILSSGEGGAGLGCQCMQIGSETSGNFQHVLFSNVSCSNAGKAGIGITSMDGSDISDITFLDISLRGTTEPVHLYVGARAWERRPEPYKVGTITRIYIENMHATHVTGKPPSFSHATNFTATMDGQGVSQNVSSVHAISEVHVRNLSIHYEGGGVASDATQFAEPFHDPNNGGPRIMGPRPSFGLFMRHLKDSSMKDVQISFESNDDRPAIICIECKNVSFVGSLVVDRGSGSRYDVGLRNSSDVVFASPAIVVCDYPACPNP